MAKQRVASSGANDGRRALESVTQARHQLLAGTALTKGAAPVRRPRLLTVAQPILTVLTFAAIGSIAAPSFVGGAAHAQSIGGAGGNGGSKNYSPGGGGGAGGTGSGAAGQSGGGGTYSGSGGGGGGGAAGGAGGDGASGGFGGVGGAGGAAGTSVSLNGQAGSPGGGGYPSTGGGGGGGGGFMAGSGTLANSSALLGGSGGAGGASGGVSCPYGCYDQNTSGGGGGGGAGGSGFVITAASSTNTNQAGGLVRGGVGGAGGYANFGNTSGVGGAGGDGGVGVEVSTSTTGVTLNNSAGATIAGGAGGVGGGSSYRGTGGNGGAGGVGVLLGASSTLNNSGTITGGTGGLGGLGSYAPYGGGDGLGGIGGAGVNAATTATVTNNAGGVIRGGEGVAGSDDRAGSAGGTGVIAITITDLGTISGGTGGAGGAGAAGGAGGTGAIVDGSTQSFNVSVSGLLTGGTGGAGGAGGQGAVGGVGGAGGEALNVTSIAHGGSVGYAGTIIGGTGGAGGAGGAGQQVSGAGLTISAATAGATGGAGGAGGAATSANVSGFGTGGTGGAGGIGGAGVALTTGSTVTVTDSVTGGTGGAGGAGGTGGTAGAAGTGGLGGAGISGSGIGVTLGTGGTVSGGLSNDGLARADSIDFTGGNTNSLTLDNTTLPGALVGSIGVAGTLSIDPGTQGANIQVGIHDLGSTGNISKIDAGNLTLNGPVTVSGTVEVAAGQLSLATTRSGGGAGDSGYGSGVLLSGTGAVLALGSTAAVQGGGYIGVRVTGVNDTVSNLGSITNTGTAGNDQVGAAIADYATSGTLTIINGSSSNATALLEGHNNGINQRGSSAGTIALNNYGVVKGDVYSAVENSGSAGLLKVTNFATGTIYADTSGNGLNVNGSGGATVTNAGKITGINDGIYAVAGANISNSGTIASGSSTNYGTGSGFRAIDVNTGTLNLTNSGTIASSAQTLNAGTINATNIGTISSGTFNTNINTLLASNVNLLNAGTIQSGNTAAIYAGAAAAIVNAAAGHLNSAGSNPAVYLSAGSVDNYGSIANGISGGNGGVTVTLRAGSTTGAITTGSGNDTLTLYNGQINAAAVGQTYNDVVSGSNASLTLQNAGTLSAASIGSVNLGGGTNTLVLAGAGNGTAGSGTTGTINTSTIANLTNLVKQDAGTWLLTGSGVYTGTTAINGGTLVESNTGSALGTGGVSIAQGATLQFANQTGGQIYVKGTTFTGAGTLKFTGNGLTALGYGGNGNATISLSTGGLIDVESGTFQGSSSDQGYWTGNKGGLIVASNAIFDAVEGTVIVDALNGAGTVQGGYYEGSVLHGSLTVGINNGSGTFAGTIQNGQAPLILTKAGGGVQTLTGTDTYSGATTISGGTLALAGTGSIATSSGIADNAIFDISQLTNGGATIGALTGTGSVKLGGNRLTLSAPGTFGGSISDGGIAGGTAGSVTLSGAGTYVFTGANSYTGVTTINSGATLQGTTGTLSASSAVADNGTLAFVQGNTGGTFVPAITGNGIVTVSGTGANTLTFAGAIGSSSQRIGQFAVTDASNVTLNGGLYSSQTVALGGGTLTNHGAIDTSSDAVTAAPNAAATVINTASIQGALSGVINNSNSGTGALTVANSGTIHGVQYDGVTQHGSGALTVTNSGVIYGEHQLNVNGWGVGSDHGGQLTLTNNGGTIVGSSGVIGSNALDSITNTGTIASGTYNTGTGAITVGGSYGVQLSAGGTVTNGGTIGGYIAGIESAASLVLTNTGTITAPYYAASGSTEGAGIALTGGTASRITNSGSIAGGFNGIEVTSGAGGTITNTGTIQGANDGNGIEVFAGAAATLVANSGTIAAPTLANSNAWGVVFEGAGHTLVNAGTVKADEGLELEGTATVTNAAAGQIMGTTYGIQMTAVAGALTLTNYGTVTGPSSILGTGANALSLLAGSTTGAITTGSGADTLSLYTGSVTTAALTDPTTGLTLQAAGTHAAASVGTVNLGTGANVVALRGSGDGTAANGAIGSFSLTGDANLATVTKQDAGTWVLTDAGTTKTTAGITRINAGTGAAAGLLQFNGTSGLTAAIAVNGAKIQALSAGAFGTGTITAIDPTIEYSATGTYANPIVLASASTADPTNLQVDAGQTATLTGAITSSTAAGTLANQAVVANGGGTLVLTNAGNSWTGLTTISNGSTLSIAAAGNVGTGGFQIGDAATAGTLTTTNIGAVTLTGAATLGAGGATINVANAAGNTTLSGPLSGAGLVKAGAGTLTLTAAETYTGPTTINAGTLALSGTGSVADSAIADGGAFDISGLTNGGTSIASLSGNGLVALGANTLTVGTSGSDTTFSGQFTGTGGLTIAGGTLTLAGTNSFGGAVDVAGSSTLALGADNVLASTATVTVEQNAIFNLNNHSDTIATLNLYGTLENGGLLTATNYNAYAGSAIYQAIGTTGTLTVNGGGAGSTMIGADESVGNLQGAGALTLASGQTLTVSNGSGSFSGAIAGAGTLALGGGTLTLAGDVTNSGGIAVGNGAALTIAGTDSSMGAGIALAANGGTGGVTTLIVAAGGSYAGLAGPAVLGTGNVQVINYGTISGGGATAIALSGGTVANAGGATITGAVTSSAGLNFYNAGSAGAVSDSGTVADAMILAPGSITGTVTTGSGDDMLTLYGGMGTASPALTGGNPQQTLVTAGTHAAATVGAIDLGGGANALVLRGVGDDTAANGQSGSVDLSTVSGAGTIAKRDTGTWTLSGAVSDPVTQAATIEAGNGSPSGLLVFAGSGLTGAIDVNGAVIRAVSAGAFGTGTITAIDPTIQYGASGTYANPIVLAATSPATDPTVLETYGPGITATLSGAITESSAGQPLHFASIDTDGTANSGTFVLTNTGNSWSGTTSIAGDTSGAQAYATTLVGTTGTISGSSIVDDGVLVYNQSADGVAGQAISGAGVVQISGGGDVSLTGAVTAAGGIKIGDASSATVSNVSTMGAAAVTLVGDNATLNVAQGGSVVAANGGAVFGLGQNGTVNNAGTITSASTTTSGFAGIFFNGGTGTNTVNNSGTISGYNAIFAASDLDLTNTGTLTGVAASAVTAYGALGLTNSGTISTAANNYAVYATGGGTISNQAGGTIAGGAGILAQGAPTSIDNAGTIRSQGVYDAIDFGGGGSIVNEGSGTLVANGDPQAYGVYVYDSAASVTNAGTIMAGSGLVTQASGTSFANSGTITAQSYGVWGNGASFTLANTGTITGGTAAVLAGTAGSAITNAGTIAGSAPGAVGVYLTGGTLTNQAGGTIAGGRATDAAIAVAGSNNMVRILAGSTVNGNIDASATTDATNSYRIGGTLAGSFIGGSGDDVLTLYTPAAIAGTLDGGAGNDTLVLDGRGAGTLGSAQVANFETGIKQGSGSWTLTGTTAASPTSWQLNAGTLTVAGGDAIADTATVAVAQGATLDLANSETIDALNGAGSVTLGANMLSVGAGNGSGSFAGTITGTGGLIKLGTGTQTLSGANGYTGATTVGAGTLALGADGVLSNATAVTVDTGATLDLGAFAETVASLTLGGTLAGTGTLTAATYTLGSATVNANLGAGTLTQAGGTSVLNGTAAASTVDVDAGTLVLGASDRLADNAAVTVASGATLDLGANADTVGSLGLGGTLAGTGTLTAATYTLSGATVNANLGTGTLTQAGGTSVLNGTAAASTVDVDAGTLVLGESERLAAEAALSVASGATFDLAGYSQTVGSVNNAGTIALGAGTLTDTGSAASIITGDITGTGRFVQSGGTLALSGAKSLTGTIELDGGTTRFTGSTAGSLRIAGGTLTGNAAVAGNLTLASGTVSPGGSGTIGSFSAGSLTVSGGTLAADVAGSAGGFASDMLKVTGAATLTGGTVSVAAIEPLANYKMTQDYVLVQAGSLTGSFSTANSSFQQTSNDSGLYYRLRYDLVPNEVLLELRKSVDFTQSLGAGASANQYAVARALNGGALIGSDAYVNALTKLAGLTAAQQASAFRSLSGEGVADITTAAITASNRFMDMLRDRISIGGVASGDPQMLLAGLFGSQPGSARAARVGASTQGAAMGLAQQGTDGPFGGSDERHVGLWAQGFGAAGTLDGRAGTTTLTDDSTGIAAGVDAQIGLLRIGGAFASDHLDTKLRSLASTSKGNIRQGALYAAYDNGHAYANVIGSYFSGTVASTRELFAGGASLGTAVGRPDLTGWSGAGAAGYRIVFGSGLRLTPEVDGGYTHVKRDAFSEAGAGVFSLDVAEDKRTAWTAGGQLRLSKPLALGGGTVEPYVSGGVVFNLGDRDALAAMRFDGAPTGTGAFVVEGAKLPREAARLTTGLQVQATTRVSFGVGAEALLADRQHEGAVNMHIRIGF